MTEKTEVQASRNLAIQLNNGAADILSRINSDTRVSADELQARSTFACAAALRSIAVSLVRIGDLLEAGPTARRGRWPARQRRPVA
jgi:hypothetical protein